ncbi:MAG: putative Co/Zn/Cd efflux system rane fusion protein [Labilithrix sp.]|nr:putative Co/Zn/Cd efflux system rane fusion protein [Labilithrix sp.]
MSLRDPNEPHDPHTPPGKAGPAATDDLGFELPPPRRMSLGRIAVFAVIALVVLGGAFLVAFLPKRARQHELATATKQNESALLRVQVVAPKVTSSDRSMMLPGSVQPLEETTVYPRSSGYVRKWLVDIGDRVKEGQVLADIDQPEVEQQLEQARAQLLQAQASLVQAQANQGYSATTLERYKKLAPSGVASQQELDQHQAQSSVDQSSVKVANAAIAAQQANVNRLAQLKSWGQIQAPFAGTVNARWIEKGALVSPTTALFRISATDPVRVFVQVPQDVAPNVRNDVVAKVSVREFPGRTFDGKVARSAGSLDPATRTMNTEVRVPNPKGELLAGMYANVALTLPSPHRVFELPATAVMNDAKGLRVAMVGPDNKIKLVPVMIERDTGPTMELSTGVSETDRVVKLASPDLVEGRQVEIAQ